MKIICVGRNYAEHIEELNNERPDDPVIFLKPDSAILAKGQPFFIPDFSEDIHYETELLVRIDRLGKHIDVSFAHKYYHEIGLGIDFTARDVQGRLKAKGLPWEKAKAFDGSALIGPWLAKDHFEAIDAINFHLCKNDEIVQRGNTRLMLWKIDTLIAYISTYFTLKIGDIIFTGTPAGVGRVVSGDVLEGYIEKKKQFRVQIK